MEKVAKRVKQDADYIFHELTRSICPECKTVIDAQIIIRDNKVYYLPVSGQLETNNPGMPVSTFGMAEENFHPITGELE